MLVDHTIASAAERQREHRHHRRAGPQRQRRHRRRRRGRALEEIDIDRIAAHDVLIDQNGDAVPGLQHPHHPADRAPAVDHGVARALPDPLEQIVEMRVVERPGQHAIGSSCTACAIACSSQKPKWPVMNSTPLPCA